MKKVFIVLIILFSILQLIFFYTYYLYSIQFLLIVAWVISYYIKPKYAIVYIFIAGFFVEIITFLPVGIYALSTSLSFLILYLLVNRLNILDLEKKSALNIIGLVSNIILFFLIKLIILKNLEWIDIIIGAVITLGIFLLILQIVKLDEQAYDV